MLDLQREKGFVVEACGADADCAAAEIRANLDLYGIVFRDDASFCANYDGVSYWRLNARRPRIMTTIDMGNTARISLMGDEPRKMAKYFVDTRTRPDGSLDLYGGGCDLAEDPKTCFEDMLVEIMELEAGLEVSHPTGAYELMEAKAGDLPEDFDVASRPLLVACSGWQMFFKQKMSPGYEFQRSVLRVFGRNVHGLFLNDLFRAWYLGGVKYLGDSPEASASNARALLRDRGLAPSRTVVIGDSMGGFGALLLGALLEADEVLAFVPQTSAAPGLLASFGDARFDRGMARAGAQFPEHADLAGLWRDLQDRGCPTRATIFYGPGDPLDVVHAHHLANASTCVSLAYHDLPGGHGAFTRTLRDSGVLDGAIRAAFPAALAK